MYSVPSLYHPSFITIKFQSPNFQKSCSLYVSFSFDILTPSLIAKTIAYSVVQKVAVQQGCTVFDFLPLYLKGPLSKQDRFFYNLANFIVLFGSKILSNFNSSHWFHEVIFQYYRFGYDIYIFLKPSKTSESCKQFSWHFLLIIFDIYQLENLRRSTNHSGVSYIYDKYVVWYTVFGYV